MHQLKESELLFNKKQLKALIIPLIIEQALALSVGLIDTAMVAGVGEDAVSGVSLVETINVLIINLFSALAAGGAIIAGQYLGQKDKKNSRHAAKQLIFSAFFLSVFFTLICLLFNRGILGIVFGRTDPKVLTHASTYFYLTTLSYPFIALFNCAAALFRGMGNSRISMINALIMNLVNIAGNSLFIYLMDLGVFGAALATLISRIVAAITMLIMLKNPNLDIYIDSYRFKKPDLLMIKRILRIGIPGGLENSLFQIGKIIVASLVALLGTAAIAANAIGNSLAGMGAIPGLAMGLAITTVVAQCVGANKYDQADYYIKYLMKLSYISMILLNIIVLLLLHPVLALYQLSPETAVLTFQVMLIHSIFAMLLWPASFNLPCAFRASGDVKYPMIISMLSMWICRIGLSYLFALYFKWGLPGIWLAAIVDWVIRSICFIYRFISGKWKNHAFV